jgi:hypothetical protein
MGYIYSHNLGLIEKEGEGSETQDDALIVYYKEIISKLLKKKVYIEKQLNINIELTKKINSEFGFLKEKYPDEFI